MGAGYKDVIVRICLRAGCISLKLKITPVRACSDRGEIVKFGLVYSVRGLLLGYAADFSSSGTRVSGSISGSAGISCGTCCGSYGIGSGISTMLRIGTVPCEDAGVGAGSAVIRVGCRCDVLRTFDMT